MSVEIGESDHVLVVSSFWLKVLGGMVTLLFGASVTMLASFGSTFLSMRITQDQNSRYIERHEPAFQKEVARSDATTEVLNEEIGDLEEEVDEMDKTLGRIEYIVEQLAAERGIKLSAQVDAGGGSG